MSDASTPGGELQSDPEQSSPMDTVEDELPAALEDDDDLFGEGGDDDDIGQRTLDDEELDSGDDEGRNDRVPGDEVQEDDDDDGTEQVNIADIAVSRLPLPEPTDNELYYLKLEKEKSTISIEPKEWSPDTFVPPVADTSGVSPFDQAMSTIRWRHSPSDPAQLQSNARILRWSDGSLTLQFAHDPLTQYMLNPTALVAPQVNPEIPTPNQIKTENGQAPAAKQGSKDAMHFLAAPDQVGGVLRVTNKLTTGLLVDPPAHTKEDPAINRLQHQLAQIAEKGKAGGETGLNIVEFEEDPEIAAQRELQQYKAKKKQEQARQKIEQRERDKASRVMGRRGRSPRYGGLSLGGLEDDAAGRRGARKSKPKTGLRRDWSSDEDDYRVSGRTREDEYDEEDDFIAASDEEPEIVEDSDDVDDGIIEEDHANRKQRRVHSPKRNAPTNQAAEEDFNPVSRVKRRRVVSDDDDDE